MPDLPEKCPKCEKSFQGGEIPKDVREKLGYTSKYYSLVLSGQTLGTDRCTHYECPFCHHVWDRE